MVNFARVFFGIFLSATVAIVPLCAQAHPHVWVDYYVNVVADPNGISKLKFRWHFDDMFTSMVKEDFHIGKLDAKDVMKLRDSAFSNLKNYHYYMYTKLDGKEFDPVAISDFGAELKGQNLEYTFTINLPNPAKKLELSLYDPEFYVDIGPPLQEPANEQTGIMASAKMKPKDFLSSSAEGNAKVPHCAWNQGEPRVSATWGKFALFTVSCEAQ